jgi:hypothetical protein
MTDHLLDTEATYQRIAEAVKNAAFGETTILSSSTKLPVARALAFAEQQRLLNGLEQAVRLSAGHGRIHIEPRDKASRRLSGAPREPDRRRVPDRRRGERRVRGPEDPIERLVVGVVGERRTGGERRSGTDRRQARASAAPRRRVPS